MRFVLTILVLMLSVLSYGGKEKKATKQKQEPVEQQPAQQADTAVRGKADSYWEQDPRLGRRQYVSPSGTTK